MCPSRSDRLASILKATIESPKDAAFLKTRSLMEEMIQLDSDISETHNPSRKDAISESHEEGDVESDVENDVECDGKSDGETGRDSGGKSDGENDGENDQGDDEQNDEELMEELWKWISTLNS